MTVTQVICARDIHADADADTVWSYVGDFGADWHPVMASCDTVLDQNGAVLREFSDTSGTHYVERLTYLSHSDRCLSYALDAGIEGVTSYCGEVQVSPTSQGCHVVWRASIEAPPDRLDGIANGTREVFELGLAWLDQADLSSSPLPLAKPSARVEVQRESLPGSPDLSILTGKSGKAQTLVLCLHGIGGAADNWQAQLAEFGGAYNIAALDMRGYGQSELAATQSIVADHCNDILRVLKSSGSSRLVLVGLSMGAWLATSFAMRYPEMLDGLVLAGGCTGMSEASETERASFLQARATPLDRGLTPADFAADVVDVIAGSNASHDVRAALQRSMANISSDSYRDALTCFTSLSDTFDFRRLRCPVLMMTGDQDRLATPHEIRAVSRAIHLASPSPNVRFEVLNDAGHVCNLEAPDAFNTHLDEFLKGIPGARLQDTSQRAQRKNLKHSAILDAALAQFSALGFDGVSMDAIARAANVSKPTLYQYFGDKDGLFSAVLDRGREELTLPLATPTGSLVDRLWSFSWTYADFVLRPDMLSLARLILGEAARRPEVAAAYHAAGPGRALHDLVLFIEGCVAHGELQVDDPTLAAQDLWSLILSGPRDHHLHFVNETPNRVALTKAITHGLRVFLTAYSANWNADLAELETQKTP